MAPHIFGSNFNRNSILYAVPADAKLPSRLRREGCLTDIHRMPVLLKLRLPLSTDIGNANTLDMGLSCTQASDIGAPSAGNTGLVVIQTHLSLGF